MKVAINKVIKILILSDFYLIIGDGLVAPIFAIFLTGQIQGGNIEVAGYAAAIYWIVKSLLVIPCGRYLDKNHGEKDDFWFIIIGNLLAAVAVFGYIFSRLPWHIYFLQVVYAVGMAMNVPAYTAIFTRHIDKGREAFDWSVRSALIGLGAGVAGAVGAIIANRFGFTYLFAGTSIFILASAGLPFLMFREVVPKTKEPAKIIVAKSIQPPRPKQ